jgi:hypothetical protein
MKDTKVACAWAQKNATRVAIVKCKRGSRRRGLLGQRLLSRPSLGFSSCEHVSRKDGASCGCCLDPVSDKEHATVLCVKGSEVAKGSVTRALLFDDEAQLGRDVPCRTWLCKVAVPGCMMEGLDGSISSTFLPFIPPSDMLFSPPTVTEFLQVIHCQSVDMVSFFRPLSCARVAFLDTHPLW